MTPASYSVCNMSQRGEKLVCEGPRAARAGAAGPHFLCFLSKEAMGRFWSQDRRSIDGDASCLLIVTHTFNPQPVDRKARSSPWDHWEAPYNFYILYRRLARIGGEGRRGEKEAASGHHGCWRRGIESPEDQSTGWGGPPGVSGPRADRLRLVQRPLSLLVPQRRPGAALLRPGGAPGSWSERRRPHERPGWGCPLSSLTPLFPPGHQQGFLGDWRLLCSWPEGCL